VARIFSPADGQQLASSTWSTSFSPESDTDLAAALPDAIDGLLAGDQLALARFITGLEAAAVPEGLLAQLEAAAARNPAPVLGITGTGGSGKSSLTGRNWCAGSGSTRRTSCASPSSPSTRPGAGAAARCSATGSA